MWNGPAALAKFLYFRAKIASVMMKRTLYILTILWLMASLVANAQPAKMIKTKVPKRPAGQTDVLQLTAPPLETVRVVFSHYGNDNTFIAPIDFPIGFTHGFSVIG